MMPTGPASFCSRRVDQVGLPLRGAQLNGILETLGWWAGGGGLDCHHPHVCSCFFPGSVNGFFAFLIKRPVRGGHKTSSKMKIWHKGSTLGNSIM